MPKPKLPILFILALVSTSTLQSCAVIATGAIITTVVVSQDRRSLGTVIDDNLIESKIREEIHKNLSLRDETKNRISITSVNDIVLLTGETITRANIDMILEATRRVPKVRQVVNEIKIMSPLSGTVIATDSWITAKAKSKLVKTAGVPDASRINVQTVNGVVYMMGLVTHEVGAAATNEVRTLSGVTQVVKVFEYTD
ncbi:MAG TPA: BON domain-containing protein [Acidiferrobacteraceae bacterium]|nr:BON domain-containing protein [Acidiferrobacteraceae bacterium]